MKYAVIKTVPTITGFTENLQPVVEQKQFVENVVVWDGVSAWNPGENLFTVLISEDVPVEIGYICVQQEDNSYVFEKP